MKKAEGKASKGQETCKDERKEKKNAERKGEVPETLESIRIS
jgi:hypothetical protein